MSVPPTFVEVLHEQRDRIVSRFVNEVQRTELSPAGLSRSVLADHIHLFLDEIVDELQDGGGARPSRDARDESMTAGQHGEQRWAVGYDLEAVIREYGVLRHCILATASDCGVQPTTEEFETLMKQLTVGIAAAVTAYTRDRDERVAAQKARLEFLAEAGHLLSSSLDYRSTMSQLTSLVVPRLADWCAVHLTDVPEAEMPVAHVDANKAGVVRDLFVRFPLPEGAGYRHVAVTGTPQMVASADLEELWPFAQSEEHLDMMREIGTHSWLIVPLRVQQHIFGALIFAYSDSERSYEASDLALATDLAGRAAAAIDNARLYALSQQERARVEAATRAKDEFVAMVSHELRTPLNAILGWVRLMRSGTIDVAKQRHAYEIIERNAEAQSRLVTDLLDISNAMTGRMRITSSQVELASVVELAVEAVRPAADAKRITLELDLRGDDSTIRGDGERLQQVAWTLVGNAVKFTPKDGIVKVSLRRVESDVDLTVEDNGEGIAPEFLPHVFEIFQQEQRGFTRPHGGLGIGLSVAKHIVDRHGGAITARSGGQGKGATFSVRLPISPVVSTTLGVARVPAMASHRPHAALPSGLEGMRVLVVDDDPDARDLLSFVFESCGVEVRVATSAAEALGVLSDFTPDVLCSDIGLPDEDGYALIRTIRSMADPRKREIPAIALTGYGRNYDRSRALVEGFNLHMVKPVEPAALVRAVLQLVPPLARRS